MSIRSYIRHDLIPAIKNFNDKFCMFIAWNLLPRKLRYWIVIRAWADSTSGKYSHVEVPSVLAHELLKRMS